jgi:hypothetical protein
MRENNIKIFSMIRDSADEVIKAYESEDISRIKEAVTNFMLLMVSLEVLKDE